MAIRMRSNLVLLILHLKYNKVSWSTLSKALANSVKITSVCKRLLKFVWMKFKKRIKFVIVDLLCLKPCWFAHKLLLIKDINLSHTISFSNILLLLDRWRTHYIKHSHRSNTINAWRVAYKAVFMSNGKSDKHD